jgi:SAM-dependent methyltransferase
VSERLVAAGRRFARFATRAVVAHPWAWRFFRGPLRSYFGWLAPRWEGIRSPDGIAPLAAALDRLPAPPGRVLDVGTGTGAALRLAAERFPEAELVGVDLAPAMLEEARRVLPDEVLARVRLEPADASALPFPDGEFDLVLLQNMIPFPAELARVSSPGGTLVIAFTSGPSTPIWSPPETLKPLLAAAGFERLEDVAAGAGTALLARRAPR